MNSSLDVLLSRRNEYRILACMLMLLHSAMWWDFGGGLSRSLMLAHLGLFLIWQPLWSRDQRMTWGRSVIFVLGTLALIAWLNWWLIAFWLLLLIGIVGGSITVSRVDRNAHLVVLLFLVSELLIGCVPPMFSVGFPIEEIPLMFRYGLLALPFGLLFVRIDEATLRHGHATDFLYGLTLSLLAATLALGSLLLMYDSGADYAAALLTTLMAIAFFLIAISWLWSPVGGFSGLGQLWEGYLLNVGTPFERWLGGLARLTGREQTPAEFLESAMQEFAELPWVAGVRWQSAAESGNVGTQTPHSFEYDTEELKAEVYAHRPMGVALLLHGKLLILVIGHFYRAKQREQELALNAQLQAVHETGARVTHDIKNLLQSLHGLTGAVRHGRDPGDPDLQRLLEKQLPLLTQRLQLALDKLQTPEMDSSELGRLKEWWASLEAQNAGTDIRFTADLNDDPLVPIDLFDSVAENLLENARYKRQLEPGIGIEVHLESSDGATSLSVSDDGSPVDAAVSKCLFEKPVASRSGLGIGLYQAARQAENCGYVLELLNSGHDRVRFRLRNEASADRSSRR